MRSWSLSALLFGAFLLLTTNSYAGMRTHFVEAINNATVTLTTANTQPLSDCGNRGSISFVTLPQDLNLDACYSVEDYQNWIDNHGNAVVQGNVSHWTYEEFGSTFWTCNGTTATKSWSVLFNAFDGNGNSISASASVRVTETTAPFWDMEAMSKTVNCGDPSAAASIQMWLDNAGGGWVYSCSGDLTYSNDYVSSNQACGSATTVTFTATNQCGLSSTSSATLTVTDNTAPVLSGVPANTTVACSNFPPAPNVTATDACGTATVAVTERIESLTGTLSGAQEVPANSSTATGSVSGSLNLATGALSLRINVSGLSANITVAHIHNNAAGSNGPVAVDLIPAVITNGVNSGNFTGIVTLTAAQIRQLYLGRLYVNIHTSNFPGGEVRAQLTAICPRLVRTWTATDACNNTATASQTITSNDAVPPTITGVPANTTITCPATPSFSAPTANDNCGAASMTFTDATTGGPCPAGSTVVRTWVAIDACGNTTTVSSTITILAPAPSSVVTLGCSSNITMSAPVGATNMIVNFPAPTASTTCTTTGVITFTQISGPASGASFPLGTTQVCFRATDACGATSSCCFNVTVNANSNPPGVVLNCGANLTVNAPVGSTGINVILPVPTGTTTCTMTGTLNIVQISGPASGSVFPAGTSTVCYSATDACGQTASCCYTVTVVPGGTNTTASINCPANITMVAPMGATGMVVNYAQPSANTTCTMTGTLNVVQISGLPSGANFPVGTTQVCYQVTDACGGVASCCFTVTITGGVPPNSVFTLMAPPAQTISCGASINWAAPATSTTCTIGTVNVTTADSQTGTACTGITYTRTYTATDGCGNVQVATATIYQQPDNISPTFTSLPPLDQMINCGTPINYGNATATDCSGTATVNFTVTNNGTTSCNTVNGINYGYDLYVNWTATDGCGNIATANTNIWVLPSTNIAFLSKPTDKEMACSDVMQFEQPMPKSFDAPIVQIDYEDDYSLDACGAGTVVRTWTATDGLGNTCQAQQTMTILPDLEQPSISLPMSFTSIDCNGSLPSIQPILSDNCTYIDDLTLTYVEQQIGQTIQRTYIVRDACGNVNSAVLSISLIDNVAPAFTNTPLAKTINCGEPVAFDLIDAVDACEVKSLTSVDQVQVNTCSEVHTRVWTAIDVAGNMSQISQEITVLDQTAPQFSTNPIAKTVVCAGDMSFDAISAIDACHTASIYYNDEQTSPTCGNSGYAVTRTWTVNDGCNNIAQIEQVITVAEDTQAPVITSTVEPQLFMTAAQAAAWQVPSLNAIDNCNTVTLTHQSEVIDQCNFKVVYTAIDACSNATLVSQIITITDGACAPLSTNQIGLGSFKVYPNPASSRLVLELTQNINLNESSFEIYDVLGRRVMISTLASFVTEIPVAELSAGSYWLKVTSADQSASVKFVKIND
jgi:large repetitive protein